MAYRFSDMTRKYHQDGERYRIKEKEAIWENGFEAGKYTKVGRENAERIQLNIESQKKKQLFRK